MSSLLQRVFRKKNIYFIAKVQESTGVSGSSNYINRVKQPNRKDLEAPAAPQTLM